MFFRLFVIISMEIVVMRYQIYFQLQTIQSIPNFKILLIVFDLFSYLWDCQSILIYHLFHSFMLHIKIQIHYYLFHSNQLFKQPDIKCLISNYYLQWLAHLLHLISRQLLDHTIPWIFNIHLYFYISFCQQFHPTRQPISKPILVLVSILYDIFLLVIAIAIFNPRIHHYELLKYLFKC